jgi:carboxypeptidase C (cathepsin A)
MRAFLLTSAWAWLFTLLVHAEPSAATEPHPEPKSPAPETKPPNKEAKPAEDKKDKEPPPPKRSETKHSITLNGQKLDYTAIAGSLPLKDKEGKTTANIFYIAYTKDGVPDLSKRPLTFSFNGGPGSSSVWMHMGLLGPRRVKLNDDGTPSPPPYQMVDNEYSLLDETDLVFIDPVGTGYSRATKPDEAKKFYGIKEDAQSIGEFIRLYVTKNTRWFSPKFLIGESYGTTRAEALSGELSGRHHMNLNGIMLVSTVLNFETIWGGAGNDLPNVLYLPSFTAAAWYHKKLPPDLQKLPLEQVLKQSETFASGDYNQALLLGSSLDKPKYEAVLKQMARLTGLTEAYLDRANLRPTLRRFNVELLRDRDLQIGRFDARYTGFTRDRLSDTTEGDPSADAVFSVFASNFNQYVRSELKYDEDEPYEILAGVGPWNWGTDNSFANVAEILAASMTENPFLKVHVSCGFFDFATPYFASRYTFSHLNVNPALQKNITLDYYTAGHMMYLNLPDLKKQKADLARFIKGASGQ